MFTCFITCYLHFVIRRLIYLIQSFDPVPYLWFRLTLNLKFYLIAYVSCIFSQQRPDQMLDLESGPRPKAMKRHNPLNFGLLWLALTNTLVQKKKEGFSKNFILRHLQTFWYSVCVKVSCTSFNIHELILLAVRIDVSVT